MFLILITRERGLSGQARLTVYQLDGVKGLVVPPSVLLADEHTKNRHLATLLRSEREKCGAVVRQTVSVSLSTRDPLMKYCSYLVSDSHHEKKKER